MNEWDVLDYASKGGREGLVIIGASARQINTHHSREQICSKGSQPAAARSSHSLRKRSHSSALRRTLTASAAALRAAGSDAAPEEDDEDALAAAD